MPCKDILKQIGMRIKAIREIAGLSAEAFSKSISLDVETFVKYEEGSLDIPITVLSAIASKYNIELTALLTGQEPHLKALSVVKKGEGITVNRMKEYKYQDLAYEFVGKKAEVFLVKIEPSFQPQKHSYSHRGQEFNYVLEGTVKFVFVGKEYILEVGDCVYFDSGHDHSVFTIGGAHAKLLAVILELK
ncbi:MAG: XRE family transcriptional regulator [Endomicrobium sp.]|jgi:mannose-6-phosphate isomerase-like protein (cupin superfamily)|nr:XRE family transcriptional regulator [Endomicrobium sp.]